MSFANAGQIENESGGLRAHIQYRSSGKNNHIRGPRRTDEGKAQADLDAIRAAAAPHSDNRESAIGLIRSPALF